jgi:hypothetical protein
MVREVKELPVDRATSKYCPLEVKVGAVTGSVPYCATVSAPTPVPLAVALSLVAVAVPVELDDVPPCELVEPVGAAGGVGAVEPGAVTVRANVHAPASPSASESVPLTEYVLTGRLAPVETAPAEETTTSAEFGKLAVST